MKIEVKWIRDNSGTAIPHYRTNEEPKWKPYTSFPNYPPDITLNSRGMPTFRMWLKMGATLIEGIGESING